MATVRYIAFLRGINVTGHKLIKMDVLKQMFALPGFKNITTYIQSGNVLFDTAETDEARLVERIETKLKKELGYPVTTIIRSIPDIKEVISSNPYFPVPEGDARKLYVTFLACHPTWEKINALPVQAGESDELCVVNREVYLSCLAYGETKLSNTFIEKKLGVAATTRNWATVNKIIEL